MSTLEDAPDAINLTPDQVKQIIVALIREQVTATVDQAVQKAIRAARGRVD
jgi:hypothetical protein